MAGQHRRSIEDPAVAIGVFARIVVTAGAFAFSVWLLLSQQQATQAVYVLYVFVAAAGPIAFFLLGGKIKEWISAHEFPYGDGPTTGFFGAELLSEKERAQQVPSAL